MGANWSQFFPPTPVLTEANLPKQIGKVFIVTGGASGIGFEICRCLYNAGAVVYMAGRSEKNAVEAIAKIRNGSSPGTLHFLFIALDDFATIKPASKQFMGSESRLDGLFHNAGVSNPPRGSKGAQGQELQLATHCLGPYLFTELLLPVLLDTATITPPGSTRVIWTASISVDLGAPQGGFDMKTVGSESLHPQTHYTISKIGEWLLSYALGRRVGQRGILSITVNPGNLSQTGLTRHLPSWVPLVAAPLLYPATYGALTNLWAALSPSLSVNDAGKYVLPWGRLHPKPRMDLLLAMRERELGGGGLAADFEDFCKRETDAYVG